MRAVVVGGGHNGLVCAAYLARGGLEVTLLERRPVLGGACVTEELWPGFRISRAAYVVSLFRPCILRELALARHGLSLIPRRPSSFTPLPDGRSLVLGSGPETDRREIARFSARDAEAYAGFTARLERIASAVEPTLDAAPPALRPRRIADLGPWLLAARAAWRLRGELPEAAQLLLGRARDLLDEHFESEPLKATLGTDAVIGAFAGPSSPGTGYVLFHHVMGSLGSASGETGERGVWAYVRGGMGALADALAGAAQSAGARLRTRAEVRSLSTHAGGVNGVVLADGEEIPADVVVSGVDLHHTFGWLDDQALLPDRYRRALARIDYRSPVVKINLALGETPRFRLRDREDAPLSGTIHAGALDLDALDAAFEQAQGGSPSSRPMVELTLPSVLDDSLAPPGKHVASIFAQYAPALDADAGTRWDGIRDTLRDRALAMIDEVAPGFSASVEQVEVLAAPDLEREFGLRGGNIFHGAMTPDRLLLLRPHPGFSQYRSPLPGLWLCGSATHPGGGVMGAPGRNAARALLRARPHSR